MEFVPLLAASALIKKVLDFVKFALNKDVNSVVTQLAAWGIGWGVIALLAASDFAAGIMVAGTSLKTLNWASLMLVGLTAGSAGSIVVDTFKTLDNSQTSKTPALLPSANKDESNFGAGNFVPLMPAQPFVAPPTPAAPAPASPDLAAAPPGGGAALQPSPVGWDPVAPAA